MVGRSATFATCSGPFSSAIRRRASASTIAVKRADPAAGLAARLVVDPALGEQRLHDPVDELGRRDPLQRGVRRPRRQPRAAARHRAEPGDHLGGQLEHRLLVALGQRVERARRGTPASACGVVADRAGSSSSSRRPATPSPTSPREVDVEERVERRPLRLLLDQRGGVPRLHGRPVVPVERAQRGDRVQVLGERHRQPGGAQRLQEGDVAIDETTHDRSRSSRTALSWSDACLRTTPRVSAIAFSSSSPISSATRVRAQSTDSAIDGAFLRSRSRSRPIVDDQLAGDPVVEVGHLRGDDLLLPLGVRVLEVQVEAAPLDRLGQLAGGVRGEHDERTAYGGDRARARGSSPGSRTAPRAAAPRPRRRSCRPRR